MPPRLSENDPRCRGFLASHIFMFSQVASTVKAIDAEATASLVLPAWELEHARMSDEPSARVYHVSHRGQRHGPFNRFELSARRLTDDMLVWRDGMAEWVPIGDLEELRPYVRHAAVTRTIVPPVVASDVKLTNQTMPPPPIVTQQLPPAPHSIGATTIGILNIAFAALGLLCYPVLIFGNLISSGPNAPLADVLQRPELLRGQVVAFSLGLMLSAPLLISGIGLVRRKSWGRRLAFACAWSGIALQAIYLFFMLCMAVMPALGIARELDDPAIWGQAVGLMLGSVAGTCVPAIYDVVVLLMMANPAVKRSLN